ncbi:PaREP1/PaREP8 domain containing family protein [Pyrobaculum islandicum DSM 4184]|uniref:PaREP1/PaREP8 domain containing family protein n=1 Tax=Pyrobaculum islandicum (strain DSM 4184 / JCM 9189 / GEO3) TaxID=384616 RepID=A1RVV0_PYRIL|nr:PaREP1 family protein [Pyrobaculum islandicum]ABL89082.1 PaREP1/PaREP8 domain containing family protein [Pyrobaculum islandicum DSM 4184]
MAVVLPERLVREAERRGIDVGEVALEALARALELDPADVAAARVELAERFLAEAEQYVERGDAVQASEKLYKAVEECVKALAEELGVEALGEVRRRGRWDTWLLGRAAREAAERLGEDRVRLAWKDAYDIHVWGFHEAKYDVRDVKAALPLARWLVEFVKSRVAGRP